MLNADRSQIIKTQALTKIFDPGKPSEIKAVSDATLTIQTGEIVLVMGPSGSGKTTLITLLSGLMHPTSGSVTVSSKNFTSMSDADLTSFRREHIGFVFQSFHLLESMTALENVAIIHRLAGVQTSDARAKAKILLERLGLGKRLHAYPRELSGGEKQRVSIARALANNPTVIFADEPTANLDSKSGHDVMQLLCGIACEEHRTVVIVSHDQRLRNMAMRVQWMEDGKLTQEEQGGHMKWCTMDHSFK